MSDWRVRLARGAALAIAGAVVFTLGYDLYARSLLLNPSDGTLGARFHSRRAQFEELVALERVHLHAVGFGPTAGDTARGLARIARGDPRWRALNRSLRLDGINLLASDSVMYFGAAAWLARTRFDDVKGYAYSVPRPAPLVDDLDAVGEGPRRRGDSRRWHRALEGNWYLFREIGGGGWR